MYKIYEKTSEYMGIITEVGEIPVWCLIHEANRPSEIKTFLNERYGLRSAEEINSRVRIILE